MEVTGAASKTGNPQVEVCKRMKAKDKRGWENGG